MELGVSHEQSLSSLTPIVDNTFDKYNKNLVPIRSLSDHDIRIESFHYFLKACIAKHITPQLEWDDVVQLACAAYNFFPNEHSRESPFFLMFGRDPLLPLTKLLRPKLRYLGNEESILSLESL